jgi:hypothetical protein
MKDAAERRAQDPEWRARNAAANRRPREPLSVEQRRACAERAANISLETRTKRSASMKAAIARKRAATTESPHD